ncbi:MAG TPA: MFS transporter [Thermoleophilaceae bacterium]|nr:MFS transporter [Thermoleophilaceae bacterium]
MGAIVAEGFLSRLSFGIVSFALPLYAVRELGLSLAVVGVLVSLNLVVALVLKPAMGALADRFGLKRSFTASIVLRSLVSLLLVFATLPWQLFAIRSIHGVSISLRDPSVFVLIADHGGKKAIASAFAWYQTAKSVAGALGKGAGGILLGLTASDFSLVFLVAFLLSALPILVVLRYVREPGHERSVASEFAATGAPGAAAPRDPPRGDKGSATSRMLPFMGFGFLVSSTAYMLANLFPVFAVEYAGLTPAQAGIIYMVAASLALTGPFFGWLSDNVSRRLVMSVRSAANVASSVIYLVAPSFAGLTAGRALDDMGKAAFKPAWGAMMAEVAGFDKRRRARTMGAMSSGEDAGEIAGPILAGVLWSLWGVPALLGVRIALAVATELYTIALARRGLRSAGKRAAEPRRPTPEGTPG